MPAAEVEEELVTARHESTDNTLVSNVGQAHDDGNVVDLGSHQANQYKAAMPFTTGTHSHGYHLTSAELYIQRYLGTATIIPDVSLREDNAGLPSEARLTPLITSTIITDTLLPIIFTKRGEDTIHLRPNTKYWLHITATGGQVKVQKIASGDEDSESQSGVEHW